MSFLQHHCQHARLLHWILTGLGKSCSAVIVQHVDKQSTDLQHDRVGSSMDCDKMLWLFRNGAQKLLGVLITIGEAVAYVVSGMYGDVRELGAGNAVLIILQVCMLCFPSHLLCAHAMPSTGTIITSTYTWECTSHYGVQLARPASECWWSALCAQPGGLVAKDLMLSG